MLPTQAWRLAEGGGFVLVGRDGGGSAVKAGKLMTDTPA